MTLPDAQRKTFIVSRRGRVMTPLTSYLGYASVRHRIAQEFATNKT
jgi:hypothetical protein